MIKIEVQDQEVRAALKAIQDRVGNIRPALDEIGEELVDSAKGRFVTSTGPDGNRWKPNSRATIEAYIAKRGGFGGRGINKKGQALAMGKKPLIGESKDLSRQIFSRISGNTLTVGASPVYAATQQFGARMGQFGRYYQLFRLKYAKKDFRRHAGSKKGHPIPWGNIPARPFLPIRQNGELYPDTRAQILAILRRHISGD